MSSKITVIFLIYNDTSYVPGLVNAIQNQKHADIQDQKDWLEVLFMDNGSTDGTGEAIKSELIKIGSPAHISLVVNPKNMGISRALNKAFQMVTTEFALTCHCDVLFGREDYVATMLKLLQTHPKAGVITGQPTIPTHKEISFSEKMNLIVNMMDIFPATDQSKDILVPVGFAESRCDGWRMAALKAVGYYDTTLALAGEDQIMSSNMREKGYKIYQAPSLKYFLSVSSDQDTIRKLIKHQRLFGRAHPYIVLMNRKTTVGVMGKDAGTNRKSRAILRVSQLLSVAVYIWTIVSFGNIIPLIFLVLLKFALFQKYLRAVPLTVFEYFKFLLLQIPLDISYTAGLVRGLLALPFSSAAKPIS